MYDEISQDKFFSCRYWDFLTCIEQEVLADSALPDGMRDEGR